MKRAMMFGLMTAAMFGLAACGQSDKTKMVKACVADGNDKKVCTCMADKLEASLSEETFAVVAAASVSEEGADVSMLEELPPMEQMSVGINMMEAAVACGVAQSEE